MRARTHGHSNLELLSVTMLILMLIAGEVLWNPVTRQST